MEFIVNKTSVKVKVGDILANGFARFALTHGVTQTVEHCTEQIEMPYPIKKQHVDFDFTAPLRADKNTVYTLRIVTKKGRVYLNTLFPAYVDIIFSNPAFSNRITYIQIQGHADSQGFKAASTKEEQYIMNLDLSARRAIAVQSYLLKTGYNKQYTDKLMKMMVAEGKSNSEPIIENGKENYAKSRRVEFRLVLRDAQVQDLLIPNLKAESEVK